MSQPAQPSQPSQPSRTPYSSHSTGSPRSTASPRQVVSASHDTFLIKIDSDLLMACQDQAGNMSLSLAEWLQQATNENLRSMLGF